MTEPLLQISHSEMANQNYRVLVRDYMCRQHRIQLVRRDDRDPLGSICRELCTYDPLVSAAVVARLINAIDPEGFCCSIERSWNCEELGFGRIRLDSRLKDRPEMRNQEKYKSECEKLGEPELNTLIEGVGNHSKAAHPSE